MSIIKKFNKFFHLIKEGQYSKVISKINRNIEKINIFFLRFVFTLLPVRSNKIIINNFKGKGYGDNLKYIVEELLKSNIKYEIYWMVEGESDKDIPNSIHTVPYYSVKSLYHMATSKFWIDNTRKEYWSIKKKNQVYIQTWHGGLGFKKVENDAKSILPKSYIKKAKRDAKITDIMLSNSREVSSIFRNDFWFNGILLENGLPRNDKLVYEDLQRKNNLKELLKLDRGVKLVLYAPTFRDDGDHTCYNLDYDRILNAYEKRFGGEWKILLRLHPNIDIDELNLDINVNNRLIDVTSYPDITEILQISDSIISDFSSVVFDFALKKEPVFLYAPDYTNYKNTRGLRFDYTEQPFYYAFNNDMLENVILRFNEEEFSNKCKEFFVQFGLNETGKSSYIVRKIIEEVSKGHEMMEIIDKLSTNMGENYYRFKE